MHQCRNPEARPLDQPESAIGDPAGKHVRQNPIHYDNSFHLVTVRQLPHNDTHRNKNLNSQERFATNPEPRQAAPWLATLRSCPTAQIAARFYHCV